jgi:hypothetical protein
MFPLSLYDRVGSHSRSNESNETIVATRMSSATYIPTESGDMSIVNGDTSLQVPSSRSGIDVSTSPPTSFVFNQSGRIINGGTSLNSGHWRIDASDFPFFAGLADSGGTVYCGATMITRLHLVTAAHCIKPYLSKALIGRRDQSPCMLPNCFEGAIDAYIKHPAYSGSHTLRNDIALLRISTEAPESFQTELASSRAVEEAVSFVIAGMGATSEAGDYPSSLQMASVPAVPDVMCASSPVSSYISDGMMCAGMLFPNRPPLLPIPAPPSSPCPPSQPPHPLPMLPIERFTLEKTAVSDSSIQGCDWYSTRPECIATITLHDIHLNDNKCELRIDKPVTTLWISGWQSDVDFDLGSDIESDSQLIQQICSPNWYGEQILDNSTAYVQVLETCITHNETVILPANFSVLTVTKNSGYTCAATLEMRLNCSLEEGPFADDSLRRPATRVEGGFWNESSGRVETVFYRLPCYTFFRNRQPLVPPTIEDTRPPHFPPNAPPNAPQADAPSTPKPHFSPPPASLDIAIVFVDLTLASMSLILIAVCVCASLRGGTQLEKPPDTSEKTSLVQSSTPTLP